MSYWRTIRVVFAACGLCVLAFAAGVVGDLSMAASPSTHGQRVTLMIPADAPRAHPLSPLPRTSAAEASPAGLRVLAHAVGRRHAWPARAKPLDAEDVHSITKIDLDYAPKPDLAETV